jgi:predicted glycogen debranching enzyme
MTARGDLESGIVIEWLVTSGNGAFACGTADGSLLRKYDGLLLAAPDGPAERTMLLVKVDEAVLFAGATYELSTNRWRSGAVMPRDAPPIARFFLDGTTPVWEYTLGDALLEKRITMEPDANATAIRYTLLRGASPASVAVKAIVDYRDFHGNTHARPGETFRVGDLDGPIRVRPPFEAPAELWLRADRGTRAIANEWYFGYELSAERERGLDDTEDHVHAATFAFELGAGESATLRAATDSMPAAGALDIAFSLRGERDAATIGAWEAAHPAIVAHAPTAIRQLVLAAEQFIVVRSLPEMPDGHSIVAGFPWFGDWGRDAMISLPGLLLATGRPAIARSVLQMFGRLIDGGMLPNTIPNRGTPSYNTVDAALWFVDAVRAYVESTRDYAALDEFFPMLRAIVDGYVAGTRHGIHVDPADDLVAAGEPGVQLTWMDAKVGERVVTPRMGKPVEINALWYNALCTLASVASRVAADPAPYRARADSVRRSFSRYHGGADGGLLDVIDGPSGDDASIRPNQIFAVSLAHSPLEHAMQRAVVETCARNLLTPYGLRTLAPNDPAYIGHYEGDVASRDGAYHQGTAWPWLLGPYASAYARAFGDRQRARALLYPLLARLDADALGTLGEICDGDAPFTPRGAFAQAWTVGEVLRVWHQLA